MKLPYFSIPFKCCLVIFFCFALATAQGQENIFRQANVTAITSSVPVSNGPITKLNNGNTATNDYVDFFSTAPIDITFQLINASVVRSYTVYFYSTGYAAERVALSGSNDGNNWTSLDTRPSNTAIVAAVFTNNTSYRYYKFTFTNAVGGDLSPTEIMADNNEPAAPALTGTATAGDKIGLSWNQVVRASNIANAEYQLQRSTDGTNFSLLKTVAGSVLTYTDEGLTRNTPYWYMVRAVTGGSASSFSNVVKITTLDDTLRTAPTLTANANTTQSNIATLTWTLNIGGPGSFELQRSTDGTNFSLLRSFDKSVTGFNDSSLVHNTSYWYRIRGRNDISVSPYSLIRQITTIKDSLLTAPALQVSATTGIQANLSWGQAPLTANAQATINKNSGYQIERSTDGVSFAPLGLTGRVARTVLAYTDESLQPNTSYWYRLKAFNYINESPYSAVVKITTNNITAIPADITDDGGRLFVSAENSGGANAGEGSSKLIDNNLFTKWLVFTAQAAGNLSAVYKPTGSYIVTGYSLTTGGDAPNRDPSSWAFYGSLDSTNWVRLDTLFNQLGSAVNRNTTVRFNLANPGTVAYKFYRINFTANRNPGDGVRFQVSEWQVFGISPAAPEIPAALTVTGTTLNSVSLRWTVGTSQPVSKLVLQRSEDGLYFNSIDTLPGTATTYTNTGLYDSTTYFYRIQSLGTTSTAISGWSNIAKGTTLFTAGIPISPTTLALTFNSDTIIGLSWKDRSYNETGFQVERSRDGATFALLKTVAANTTTYTDSTVWPGTYFYYRVRAVNAQGPSGYSNVLKVLSEGTNNPPVATHPVIYRRICTGTGRYQFSFTGVTPGPHYEGVQQVRVTSVRANATPADTMSVKLLNQFTFEPAIVNGVVNYGFSTTGRAQAGDSAIVIVTIKDDGGTLGFGIDSIEVPVKFYFVPLTVTIEADKAMPVPRYALVTLTANTNFPGATTYQWAAAEGIEGATNMIILQVRPTRPVTYTVTATYAGGCQATASYTVTPQGDGLIVTNVLTPNGDGRNDKWIIWGIEKIDNNSVKVFDRAGRLVFTQKNYSNDWDGRYKGKPLDEGMYYYLVEGSNQKAVTGTLNIIHDHP